ncbi:TauD/TfdA family dioxygenase [uncultured Rhodoblastus sp.]|uniref:TauD/TfdA dioxygenase family protein n=1 Tax=uncultured Rhodoblastus sp. TaxID=543037 RepID=UPI0025DADA9C|nr:TauD/TfdA family dioxygenase [uncultured Rhodoblastus sp.]
MALRHSELTQKFGAELHGLDIENGLTDALFAEIVALWREKLVLVIRDQAIGDERLLRFARRFGALDPAPKLDKARSHAEGFPEIAVVSNVIEDGAPIGGLGAGELAWHSDMTYVENPPVGCILHAWETPDGAGRTFFANLRGALASLSPDEREALQGLSLTHDDLYTSAGTPRYAAPEKRSAQTHPLLARHPSWGEEILLVGRRRGAQVIGLGAEKGEALLDRIWDLASAENNVLTHVWRPGDVVIWDNLLVLHKREAFDDSQRRILHRAQIRTLHPHLKPDPAESLPIARA